MNFAHLKSIDRKYWIVAGVILLIVAALFVFIRQSQATNTNAYQTIVVKRGALTDSIGATGVVQARQSAVLKWQTSGRLETINAVVGEPVKTDEILASLALGSTPKNVILAQADLVTAQQNLNNLLDSHLDLAQAQQNLSDAKQALKNAQDAYNSLGYVRVSDELIQNTLDDIKDAKLRSKFMQKIFDRFFAGLYDGDPLKAKQLLNLLAAKQNQTDLIATYNWYTGDPSQIKVEQAQAVLDLAKARVEDAQRELNRFQNGTNVGDLAERNAKLAAAQATLNQSKIIAPFNGTITQAQSEIGDMVSPGMTAFVVEDLSQLYVDLQISEVDINSVGVGQLVTIVFDAIQGKTYHGKVVTVNLSGDTISGAVNFTVKVKMIDGDERVKPGMTAAVTVTVKEINNALTVPNRAVRVVNGQRVVYVLKDGQPVTVNIRLGVISDTASEVVGGNLQEGDQLILDPPFVVTPGSGSGSSGSSP